MATKTLIGLSLRILLITFTVGSFDTANFARSAAIVAAGHNLYIEQPYYNYTPIWAWTISPLVSTNFQVTYRLMMCAVSAALALLLARRYGDQIAAAYWCNPAIILFDGWFGQFEIIPLALLLFAGERRDGVLWPLGGAALLIKHIVLFHVWSLFVWAWGARRAGWRMVAVAALFALTFIPYLPDAMPQIMQQVIGYSSWGGYGLAALLPSGLHKLVFFGGMILLPLVWKPCRVVDGLWGMTLAYLLLTPGISVQFWFIPLTLAIIRRDRFMLVALTLFIVLHILMLMIPYIIPETTNIVFVAASVSLIQRMISQKLNAQSASANACSSKPPVVINGNRIRFHHIGPNNGTP